MSRLPAAAIVVVVLAASASLARADAAADAQLHTDKATLLYKQGKFADALTELNAAYALDPQPSLLYAMGQIEVKLGQCDDAATYYKRFVDSNPDPSAAAATQEAIAACRSGQLPAAAPVPATPPATPPTQAVSTTATATSTPTWYDDHVADGLVAGGIAAELIAAVLYQRARDDLDDAREATTYPSQLASVDSAHTTRAFSVVLAIGGVALGGAGAYHYLFMRDVETTGVKVAPTTGGAAVSWSTRF